MDRHTIRLIPQKTARKRRELEVPVTPDLERWLLHWPGKSERPEAPLFPSLCALKPGGCNGLSARFRKLMKVAKIDGELDAAPVSGKGRPFHAKTFHSLRHGFVSALTNAGVPRDLRMKLAGHTSNAHDRYTHHELATLRGAMEALPSLIAAAQAKGQ
jgi:integrase